MRYVLLALYIVSALVGAISAYDQSTAWLTFFCIVLAGFLFWFLERNGQRLQNLILIVITFLGAAVALFFLFTHNWQQLPAKIGFINQIGLSWMDIRPQWIAGNLYHNRAAGLIAMILPFVLAGLVQEWKNKRWGTLVGGLIATALMTAAFVLTTSRGAALALFFGLVAWAVFAWSDTLRQTTSARAWVILRGIVLPALLMVAIWAFLTLAGPVSFSDEQQVLSNSGSRLELYQNAIRLTQDFPWVGAGLGAFAGVYSAYVLSIPNFYFSSAHNIYLNIAVEQGLVGLFAFLCLYFMAYQALLTQKSSDRRWMLGAAFASLTIVLLHNLVDTVIGESSYSIVLFAVPGLAFGWLRGGEKKIDHEKLLVSSKKIGRRAITWIIVLIGLAIFAILSKAALASWYANLGAVQMASIQLAGFPESTWDGLASSQDLMRAEANFNRSVAMNPTNRTANHRLGLIAMDRRQFSLAETYLEAAYRADPHHRGVIKNLGYAYTWSGQFDRALPLLQRIEEANSELTTYQWWWTSQNRPDLAERAAIMANAIATGQ